MKKIVIFIFGVVAIISVFLIARNYKNEIEKETTRIIESLSHVVQKALENKVKEAVKDIVGDIKKSSNDIEPDISSPPPLVHEPSIFKSSPQLTVAGVFTWTNYERGLNKISPLLDSNSKLDEIAIQRAKDMFKRQYFEHVSPSGESASSLAKQSSYDFLAIGENLALGRFENDRSLVEAWMASPGHRANILNSKYQEIGLAVMEGIFNGEKTWLAVQIFGKPISACPIIDTSLKNLIDTYKTRILDLQQAAQSLRDEINTTQPGTQKELETYNQKIDSYNTLVNQINSFIVKTKSLISDYNNQVQSFNSCLGS